MCLSNAAHTTCPVTATSALQESPSQSHDCKGRATFQEWDIAVCCASDEGSGQPLSRPIGTLSSTSTGHATLVAAGVVSVSQNRWEKVVYGTEIRIMCITSIRKLK